MRFSGRVNVVYFFADYNATTPLCPPVVAAFNAWQDVVGNMSSSHYFGQQVHGRYDDAQYRIKSLLNAHHFELFTCSSATEANHWFIYSILEGIEGCPRVIASQIEHPCVMAPLQHYATEGCIDLQLCRVDRHGQLDMAHFDELLTSNTVLVSVMLANNEIGSIQPLQEIATKASHVGALVHSDIVQAAGKNSIDLANMPVDAVGLSSHKCYAPTGWGINGKVSGIIASVVIGWVATAKAKSWDSSCDGIGFVCCWFAVLL